MQPIFFAVDLKASLPAIAASNGVRKTEGLFLSLVPTWGMQRSLSRNFNFEWFVGAGAGLISVRKNSKLFI